MHAGRDVKTCQVSHFTRKEIHLSKTRAEAIDDVSADPLEARLQLFGHDVARNVFRTLLDCTLYSGEGNRVEVSSAQRAHLDALISTVVTYLTEWEGPGGHRQKTCPNTYVSHVTAATRQL